MKAENRKVALGVMAVAGLAAAGLWWFGRPPKPFRVIAIRRAGTNAQGAISYMANDIGSYASLAEAAAGATRPCPPTTEIRLIVGPTTAGMATLAAIANGAGGACYLSNSLAADVYQAAKGHGIALPPVMPVTT